MNELPGFYTQVFFSRNIQRYTSGRKTYSGLFRGILDNFQRVVERNRVEQGFQVMITIRSFARNSEAEIDLSIRESDHGKGVK